MLGNWGSYPWGLISLWTRLPSYHKSIHTITSSIGPCPLLNPREPDTLSSCLIAHPAPPPVQFSTSSSIPPPLSRTLPTTFRLLWMFNQKMQFCCYCKSRNFCGRKTGASCDAAWWGEVTQHSINCSRNRHYN